MSEAAPFDPEEVDLLIAQGRLSTLQAQRQARLVDGLTGLLATIWTHKGEAADVVWEEVLLQVQIVDSDVRGLKEAIRSRQQEAAANIVNIVGPAAPSAEHRSPVYAASAATWLDPAAWLEPPPAAASAAASFPFISASSTSFAAAMLYKNETK